ncbi:MAG: hypothetical protein ACREBU_00930 [Nitrososphaera sp.]
MVESDIPLVIMTGALTTVTGILAYHAMKLWTTTKEIAEKEKELKILPKLLLETVQEIHNETRCRFSVKNIGFGSAINLQGYEILSDGTKVNIIAHTQREYITPGETFTWDIPNSNLGQQKNIELKYSDILNEHVHTYPTQITVI